MVWKISCVIISSATNAAHEDILHMLGFTNYGLIGAELFDKVMYPEPGKVFICSYKNNLIVAAAGLPETFFRPIVTDIEYKLSHAFPDSEIGAVLLQNKFNQHGFSLTKNGKKIRIKTGSKEQGIILDTGDPLDEELDLLAKSTANEKGEKIYWLGDNQQKPFTEDQIGEMFVFDFFKRFTGEAMNTDDALMNVICTGYKLPGITFFSDGFFDGEWMGIYSYGEGYKRISGQPADFTATITVTNGELKGSSIEKNLETEKKATLHGFVADPFIGFVKKTLGASASPLHEGTPMHIVKDSHVTYSGIYDPTADCFKGIWKIKDDQLWGRWTMKRKKE